MYMLNGIVLIFPVNIFDPSFLIDIQENPQIFW